ncbi:MAG: DUF2946 family protein [Phycisphaerae bacterium]
MRTSMLMLGLSGYLLVSSGLALQLHEEIVHRTKDAESAMVGSGNHGGHCNGHSHAPHSSHNDDHHPSPGDAPEHASTDCVDCHQLALVVTGTPEVTTPVGLTLSVTAFVSPLGDSEPPMSHVPGLHGSRAPPAV